MQAPQSSYGSQIGDIVNAATLRHARALILQCLSVANAYTLNQHILRDLLDSFGICLSTPKLQAAIDWLQARELIRVAAGDVLVITLLSAGADVAEGRERCDGIARPPPPAS